MRFPISDGPGLPIKPRAKKTVGQPKRRKRQTVAKVVLSNTVNDYLKKSGLTRPTKSKALIRRQKALQKSADRRRR